MWNSVSWALLHHAAVVAWATELLKQALDERRQSVEAIEGGAGISQASAYTFQPLNDGVVIVSENSMM
jgi:hypothetical protein